MSPAVVAAGDGSSRHARDSQHTHTLRIKQATVDGAAFEMEISTSS